MLTYTFSQQHMLYCWEFGVHSHHEYRQLKSPLFLFTGLKFTDFFSAAGAAGAAYILSSVQPLSPKAVRCSQVSHPQRDGQLGTRAARASAHKQTRSDLRSSLTSRQSFFRSRSARQSPPLSVCIHWSSIAALSRTKQRSKRLHQKKCSRPVRSRASLPSPVRNKELLSSRQVYSSSLTFPAGRFCPMLSALSLVPLLLHEPSSLRYRHTPVACGRAGQRSAVAVGGELRKNQHGGHREQSGHGQKRVHT